MKNQHEIYEQVMEIVKSTLHKEDVKAEDTLIGKGAIMDSVTTVGLIVQIEKAFHIKFSEDDLLLEAFENVNSIVKLVLAMQG